MLRLSKHCGTWTEYVRQTVTISFWLSHLASKKLMRLSHRSDTQYALSGAVKMPLIFRIYDEVGTSISRRLDSARTTRSGISRPVSTSVAGLLYNVVQTTWQFSLHKTQNILDRFERGLHSDISPDIRRKLFTCKRVLLLHHVWCITWRQLQRCIINDRPVAISK